MGCCRKIRYKATTRSVLCIQWVMPLRIIALGSLVIHLLFALFVQQNHTFSTGFAAFIHFIVVILLLRECHMSRKYHDYILNKGDC